MIWLCASCYDRDDDHEFLAAPSWPCTRQQVQKQMSLTIERNRQVNLTYTRTLHKILHQQPSISISIVQGPSRFLQICSSFVHLEILDSSCTAAQTHFFCAARRSVVFPLAAPNLQRRLRSCLSIPNHPGLSSHFLSPLSRIGTAVWCNIARID